MTAAVSSPHLERLTAFPSRVLDRARDVTIYLPPGYAADPWRRYPVLYMHDGQNLFDPETAYVRGQHWRLGEMADMLIAEGRVQPLMIVGVNHTGAAACTNTRPPAIRASAAAWPRPTAGCWSTS